MKEYEVIRNYRRDDAMRAGFNELAKETFGLDFEDWYQNGYWGENYNPYSIVIDGKTAANVSVNRTNFIWRGERKRLIQLGTVMTGKEYRNQGLIRRIMNVISEDYKDQADGIYLFANDSVLDFYPKFGFRRVEEYQYTKTVSNKKEKTMARVPMENKKDWDEVERALEKSVCNSALWLENNSSLMMFYLTKFMQENVYFEEKLGVYAVAKTEGENLLLSHIFSERPVNLTEVAEAFGKDIKRVSLGFTPCSEEGFEAHVLRKEDTALFVKGKAFENFEDHKMMFPLLAHA